jgi:hypothetical protein
MEAIRELAFDNFVIPCFFIATVDKINTITLQVKADRLTFVDASLGEPGVTTDFLFSSYPTLKEILAALTASTLPIDVFYSGSFIGSEPTTSLTPSTAKTLELYRPIYRSYFFSDNWIYRYFIDYAIGVLHVPERRVPTDWVSEINSSKNTLQEMRHLVIWTAYHLVGDRRLYELAATQMIMSTANGNQNQGSTFMPSSDSFSSTNPGENVTMNVADIFSINEDAVSNLGVQGGGQIPKGMLAPWELGSDNILMDYYSFWYRLQLYIREQYERLFADMSLRQQTVMTGKIHQDPRDSHNWWAYFDSYPWVFNPYVRGVSRIGGIGQNF